MKRRRSERIRKDLAWLCHELQETSHALYTLKTIHMNPYFDWQSWDHAHRAHVLAGLILDLQDGANTVL